MSLVLVVSFNAVLAVAVFGSLGFALYRRWRSLPETAVAYWCVAATDDDLADAA
jgi:hypothetical protein